MSEPVAMFFHTRRPPAVSVSCKLSNKFKKWLKKQTDVSNEDDDEGFEESFEASNKLLKAIYRIGPSNKSYFKTVKKLQV